MSAEETSDPGKRTAFRYLVVGRVQGVGFRWWTRQQARRLNISGDVRNRRDGSVEIFALGDPSTLKQFEELLAAGPPGSRVDSVGRTSVDAIGDSGTFQIVA